MKKITGLILVLVFASCDPLFHDDFIIVNNCDTEINVSVSIQKGNKLNYIVNPQSEYLFFYDEWIGGVSKPEKIDHIFEEIIVIKDSAISAKNYVNHALWKKENVETSRKNQYYTNVRYYLTINPEDFE